MWSATCRECEREVPNGLKKKQLEALVEKDERDSRKRRHDTREKREATKVLELVGPLRAVAAATRVMQQYGPSISGHGWRKSCGRPRRGLPRLLRRTLTHRLPPTASTECTATVEKVAKVLTDLDPRATRRFSCAQLEESKKERNDAQPLLGKIQAAEKRLRTRQEAEEASTAKRDQLQLSLQAVQDKLHEALTVRRE